MYDTIGSSDVEQTLQTTDKQGPAWDGETPVPLLLARRVEKAFSLHVDVDIDLVGYLTPDGHERDGKIPDSVGISPSLDQDLQKTLFNMGENWNITGQIEQYFGESTGSANITTAVVRHDLTISQVVRMLALAGELEKTARRLNRDYSLPVNPALMTGYVVWTFSKGWIAEKIMDQAGWFSKGGYAQDEGGIDGYRGSDEIQIGSITRANSQGAHREADNIRNVVYKFHGGKVHITDLENFKELAGKLKRSEMSKTKCYRSYSVKADNRSFRYLWW